MPLYTYEDEETGLKVDLRRPVEQRDKPVVLRRKRTVPSRLSVLVPSGATESSDFNNRMLKAHHKKEEVESSRFKSSYDKKTIKKVWSE